MEDRLALLLLMDNKAMFSFFSSTLAGEVIFGDFVCSIQALRYLNNHINRQMFDLYLLNSQNMAVSLKYDNLKFTKNEEESVEKLEDYNKQFLQPTKNLLSKKLESY